MLLILDNCEHVLRSAARLAEALTSARCGQGCSCEALLVPGEHVTNEATRERRMVRRSCSSTGPEQSFLASIRATITLRLRAFVIASTGALAP